MTGVTKHTRADRAKDPNCVTPVAQVALVNNSFVKLDELNVSIEGWLIVFGPGQSTPPSNPQSRLKGNKPL